MRQVFACSLFPELASTMISSTVPVLPGSIIKGEYLESQEELEKYRFHDRGGKYTALLAVLVSQMVSRRRLKKLTFITTKTCILH